MAPGSARSTLSSQPTDDISIVHEERVRDARESCDRFFVAGDERLASRVGAGHYQYEVVQRVQPRGSSGTSGGLVKQQVMQRCVGQHYTEPGDARSDAGQLAVTRTALAQQDDAAFDRLHERPLRRLDLCPRLRRRDIGHHHRERLFFARLARTQAVDGDGIARVAGKMEAAQPLDGHDVSAPEPCHCFRDRIDARDALPAHVEKRELRAALGARIRLGVKAAIEGRAVFAETRCALLERCHARRRTIVRQVMRDRVARTTIGAVDERVPVASIVRIEHFAQTVAAERAVGPDRRGRATAATLKDSEARSVPLGRTFAQGHTVDAGKGWCVLAQAVRERFDVCHVALDFDSHASGIVANPPIERQVPCQPIDERSESDTLHDATYFESSPDNVVTLHRLHVGHGHA